MKNLILEDFGAKMMQENVFLTSDGHWSKDGLEEFYNCPVCRQSDRRILYGDLTDNTYRVALGHWVLWKCGGCGVAYLNPRPTPATIQFAYNNYYTHDQAVDRDDYEALSAFRRFRRRLVNGYTNWRYSTTATPASAWGVIIAFLFPSLKRVLDRQYRHLPRLPKGGGSLLDVGCGNGTFLRLATLCGWDALGVDPDSKAVSTATRSGLNVYLGGVEQFKGEAERFDVITLNHVIEHVHDPLSLLETCHALLKPGGQLWIETPNIDSFGHLYFGADWRGLEAPRHLVLFNRRTIHSAFSRVGFSTSCDLSRDSVCAGMFKASLAIKRGQSPVDAISVPRRFRLFILVLMLAELLMPSRREFLTVMARK